MGLSHKSDFLACIYSVNPQWPEVLFKKTLVIIIIKVLSHTINPFMAKSGGIKLENSPQAGGLVSAKLSFGIIMRLQV